METLLCFACGHCSAMSASARTLFNLNTHHGTLFSVLDDMVECLMGQLCSVHLLKVKFIYAPVQMS